MRNLLHHSVSLMASHIVRLPRNLIVMAITGYQKTLSLDHPTSPFGLRRTGGPFIWLITVYQKTLSPDHGPLKHLFPYGYCRHSPTCSVYAKNVISKRGVVIGVPMAVWRVLCCNPFVQPSDERVLEVATKR